MARVLRGHQERQTVDGRLAAGEATARGAQQRNRAVMTSDPDDIARVDPRLPSIRV